MQPGWKRPVARLRERNGRIKESRQAQKHRCRMKCASRTSGGLAGILRSAVRADIKVMLQHSEIPHALISRLAVPGFYLLSITTRSYCACVGRALLRYNLSNCAISAADAVTECFNTNQVTPSLHGGVVSDPGKV